MRVAKWGNGLAVRLPKGLVAEPSLAAGAELSVVAASKDEIAERDRREEFLKAISQFNWPAPEGYRFDRKEANER
jgi:antitoxin MazE